MSGLTHRPRKRFGQNFLRDPNVLAEIVEAIQPKPTEHLVEIGPGQGALTQYLLASRARLDVVELDRDLVAHLQTRFGAEPLMTIHQGDALSFSLADIARGGSVRVVGNLPYNISTPLLFRLFEQSELILDMHFMLQREVVQRLCAARGGDDYGRLSVMAQYHCRAIPLFEVAPNAFYPPPKVTSQVVCLLPYRNPPVDVPSVGLLGRVVTAAFAQRRKTLRNALRDLLNEGMLMAAGVNPNQRAEELALEDFAALARQVAGAAPSES